LICRVRVRRGWLAPAGLWLAAVSLGQLRRRAEGQGMMAEGGDGEMALAKAALAALNDPAMTAAVRGAVNAHDEAGLQAQRAQADFGDAMSRLDALLLSSSDDEDGGGDGGGGGGVGGASTGCRGDGSRTLTPLVAVGRGSVSLCRQSLAAVVAEHAEQGGDGWSLQFQLLLPPLDNRVGPGTTADDEPYLCHVRAVRPGDEDALLDFGLRSLSDASRATFAPFEWGAKVSELRAELKAAVDNSVRRQDLHVIAIADGHAPAIPDVSDMRGRVVRDGGRGKFTASL
jgi:hypothetical protein